VVHLQQPQQRLAALPGKFIPNIRFDHLSSAQIWQW
jgi:hypothetical protein